MTGEPLSACTLLARRRKLYTAVSLVLFAPLLISTYWPGSLSLDIHGYPIGRDFINVWAGPRLAFSGQLATLFDFPRYETAIGELFGQPLPFHSWVYPLYALPAFWPPAQLPYFVALAVWTFGSFALFAGVVLRQIAPDKRAAALVMLACAPACLNPTAR